MEDVFIVQRIPIFTLIMYFVIYLVLHIGIGMYRNYLDKEYKKTNDFELGKQLNIFKHIFRWFPAAYVIFLIIMLS